MGFHRPSGSTLRTPASGKPSVPGQFGPVFGSADAPISSFAEALNLGPNSLRLNGSI
jgi:hypothetical protein